jgi:hypothetical protein
MNEPVLLATHFFGKGNGSSVCFGKDKGCPFHGPEHAKAALKYHTYVIVRARTPEDEDSIKLAELPYSVIFAIGDLEEDDDWAFEGYPMPYDITVKCDKENSDPKQIYKTTPSPLRKPVSEGEMAILAEKMETRTPEQYVAERKAKSLEKAKSLVDAQDVPEFDEADIPM